jgi:GT2 family glycosyltransferase
MVQHYPALNRPAAPVCSVCIANYNGVALLVDCLESVLAQEGNIGLEIIVHDDASTDDSVALIREKYRQVELLASSENVGFCIANNRMVELARGEFVLLLNNDASLYPDALSTLLRTAREQKPSGILTLPQYDWTTGNLVDRGCLLDPFYNPTPNLDPRRTDVAMTIGACLFIRRELWTELGGFPEWIGSIAEDLYLCCVARLSGEPVLVTGTSGYRHRQGASFGGNRASASEGLQTTFRRRYLSERNKTSVLLICTPTLLVWPLLALHILVLCLEGTLLTAVKRDGRIWQQIYGATLRYLFDELAPLRKRRQQVQRQRRNSFLAYLRGFSPIPRKLSLLRRYGIPRVR